MNIIRKVMALFLAFGKPVEDTKTIKMEDKTIISDSLTESTIDWKEEFTLGSGNSFWWKIDSEKSVYFKRSFKNAPEVVRKLSYSEVKAIDAFVRTRPEWTDLANNVEKMAAGTEIDGLGAFMYEFLRNDDTDRRSTTDGQLSSHLGALFVHSGAWHSNEKRKGIQFKANSGPFWNCLEEYYRK